MAEGMAFDCHQKLEPRGRQFRSVVSVCNRTL